MLRLRDKMSFFPAGQQDRLREKLTINPQYRVGGFVSLTLTPTPEPHPVPPY